jgi:hypothetical protein
MTIPEYYPLPRVEAWLTLPPGVVPKRDLIESGEMEEPYEYESPWLGPTPPENKSVMRRFIAEFGEDAAYAWKFPVPSLAMRIMRDVFSSERLEKQFYAESPFMGKLATIPIKARASD